MITAEKLRSALVEVELMLTKELAKRGESAYVFTYGDLPGSRKQDGQIVSSDQPERRNATLR